ncbi:hypothetical protein KQI84_12480 [bacterium]|nr:hypothetical protein [bacterium]
MKRRFAILAVLVLTASMLSSCAVFYYDHVILKDNKHEHYEFGLLGFPEDKVDDHGPGGLVPIYRTTNPVEENDIPEHAFCHDKDAHEEE